jgi:D-alanine-D-alanine ligase
MLKTIGVIFGSRSTEHDVSIITALSSIVKPLEASKQYRVVAIYIAKDGKWYCDEALKDVGLYTSGTIDDWTKRHEPMLLSLKDGLSLVAPHTSRFAKGHQAIAIDIAFPALHGTHGEDGELMGVLEMAGVPYVGCGVAASAVAMDKVLTKLVAQASGIKVAPFVYFTKGEFEADADRWVTQINRKLHYPLFVKPAHLGSSIGITRVAEPKDLRDAIEVALHYDDKALVEEGIQNLVEVTLPIMGNVGGKEWLRPALLEQPITVGDEFFDFETKYLHGGKKGGKAAGIKGAQGYSILPAKLSEELYSKAESVGLAVYKALGCTGTARVDMLIDTKTKTVYCNEVNPLPGSLYQHNWQQAGVSPVDLVMRLVELALERASQRAQLEAVFSTNFLKQF